MMYIATHLLTNIYMRELKSMCDSRVLHGTSDCFSDIAMISQHRNRPRPRSHSQRSLKCLFKYKEYRVLHRSRS